MRDGSLGPLRQHQSDAIAARDAHCSKRVRKAVRVLLQIEERPRASLARFILPVQRESRAIGRPSPAAGLRNVEIARNFPAVRAMELGVTVGRYGAHACALLQARGLLMRA